jgi:hypothetical protein
MEEPLFVVRNTATTWLTVTSYDLFVYDDRLVSVAGLTTGSGLKAARRHRKERGRVSMKEGWDAQGEDADRRVAEVLATPEPAVLERRGSTSVAVDDVVEARLRKRAGLCKLVVKTSDGRKQRWRWMNVGINGTLDEAEPVLRHVFGERLRG